MLEHQVARLTKRKRDAAPLKCHKCLAFNYPECFAPVGLRTEHRYCNYCAITVISEDCKVTQDITALLFDKPPQELVTVAKSQRRKKENEKSFRTFLMASLEPECKIDEYAIELMCQKCSNFYPVWNIDRVPTSYKKHVCPLCRAKKLLGDSSLGPIFTKYVRAIEARHAGNTTTSHLLNVDFISYHRHNFLSGDNSNEDMQCISTLAEWLNDESDKTNSTNEEDVVILAKYYENRKLSNLISAKALEDLYEIQTGIKADFLKSNWNTVPNMRRCCDILNDAKANVESVRQYTKDEVRRVIEDGIFATNKDTLAKIEEILPKQMLNKDQFLALEPRGIYYKWQKPHNCEALFSLIDK